MLVECKNCGAPLDVNGVERFIRCSYCDKVNRVRTMRTMAFQTPPQWQPPQTWQPPPQFGPFRPYQYHRVSSPIANRIPLIVLGFVVMISLAGVIPAIAGVLIEAASARSSRSAPPRAERIRLTRSMRQPELRTVTARGERLAGEVTGNPQCAGYIASDPQAELVTGGATSFAITGLPNEAVVVIRTSTGEHLCSQGPTLTGRLSTGTHRLWAGVRQNGSTPLVTLNIRAAIDDRIRPSASPSLAELSERRMDLTADTRLSGVVDARVDALGVDPQCRGFVSAEPQLTVDLMEARRVAFAIEQHADELLLMVRTRAGRFFCEVVPPAAPLARSFDLPRGESALWIGVTDLTARGQYSLRARAAD